MPSTSYLTHAWRSSLVLYVHGLMTWVWAHEIINEICKP